MTDIFMINIFMILVVLWEYNLCFTICKICLTVALGLGVTCTPKASLAHASGQEGNPVLWNAIYTSFLDTVSNKMSPLSPVCSGREHMAGKGKSLVFICTHHSNFEISLAAPVWIRLWKKGHTWNKELISQEGELSVYVTQLWGD